MIGFFLAVWREFLEFHVRGVEGATFAGVDGGAVLVKCADRHRTRNESRNEVRR